MREDAKKDIEMFGRLPLNDKLIIIIVFFPFFIAFLIMTGIDYFSDNF